MGEAEGRSEGCPEGATLVDGKTEGMPVGFPEGAKLVEGAIDVEGVVDGISVGAMEDEGDGDGACEGKEDGTKVGILLLVGRVDGAWLGYSVGLSSGNVGLVVVGFCRQTGEDAPT